MMDEKIFSKVCTETLEILANVSDEEYDKISPDFIEMLYKNSDKEYVFDINVNQEFAEQELMEETYDMLAYIYRKYWCDENDKGGFKSKILNNELENKINKETVDVRKLKEEMFSLKQLTIFEKNNFLSRIKNMMQKIFGKK